MKLDISKSLSEKQHFVKEDLSHFFPESSFDGKSLFGKIPEKSVMDS